MENKFEGYIREVCDFTKIMDRNLKYRERMYIQETYCYPTYLMYNQNDLKIGKIPFRFPGATRGYIYLKSDLKTIARIEFDYDVSFGFIGCYEVKASEEADKFVGKCLWEGLEEL